MLDVYEVALLMYPLFEAAAMTMQKRVPASVALIGLLASGALGLAGCVDSLPTATGGCDVVLISNLKDTYAVGESAIPYVTLGSSGGIAAPCPYVGMGAHWSSSDPAVVSITDANLLVATGVGTAIVSVRLATDRTAARTLHVVPQGTPR